MFETRAPAAVARDAVGEWSHGVEALDAGLLREVHAPAALRRALARVAARMVATRGWERLGFARLADYAVERAGVSARELRDLARVERALGSGGLRALEAAFLGGRIGWTQLRLLCRVAEPATQGRWLALAEALTARELAREVRAVDARAGTPLEIDRSDARRREGVVLRLSRRARARWWSARGMACKVAGHRLSHGEFAELLTAEVLSGIPLGSEPGEEAQEASAERIGAAAGLPSRSPPARGMSTAAPLAPSGEVSALERDLASADAFELDARLRSGLALEARGLARVASRLADAVAWEVPRAFGFPGLDAYAEERLGMSPSRARALLRIERAAARCSPLREAFASGRVSWVQAHTLLPLLLEPGAARHREDWLERAGQVSVRRLRDDAERALALGEWAPPPLEPAPHGSGGGPEDLQTGAIARSSREDVRLFFTASPEVAALFRAVLATVQRRLERIRGRPASRSEALEAMLDHALAAWRPEPPTARERREWAVFERDGWRCAAPGCTSYRNLQRHHVVFRSQGGGDEDSNLVTLCVWHHLRGVHGGVLRCTGTAPGRLRFELGLRPGRPALACYRSGEVRCA